MFGRRSKQLYKKATIAFYTDIPCPLPLSVILLLLQQAVDNVFVGDKCKIFASEKCVDFCEKRGKYVTGVPSIRSKLFVILIFLCIFINVLKIGI